MSTDERAPALRPGDVVGGTWVVSARIGSGTFSEIYAGVHVTTGVACALKVDRQSARSGYLQWESDIMLQMQKYPFVPRHYGYLTSSDGSKPVLAMQLMSYNISSIRRRQPNECFEFGCVMHIGLQMLHAVEAMHQTGYVHRDLKPSNIVISARGRRDQMYIIDFGQSRMYLTDDGSIRLPRASAEFRGTSLYSSLNAHLLQDLGRRDDLWSLFYVLVDMMRGGLPWRPCKDDRKRCEALKTYYTSHPQELLHAVPGAAHLLTFHAHIASLSFADEPDYGLLRRCLLDAIGDASASSQLAARLHVDYPQNEVLASCVPTPSSKREMPTVAPSRWLNHFDLTTVPLSCDAALASRGGRKGEWPVDSDGAPAHTAFQVDPSGAFTSRADAVFARITDEIEGLSVLAEESASRSIADAALQSTSAEDTDGGDADPVDISLTLDAPDAQHAADIDARCDALASRLHAALADNRVPSVTAVLRIFALQWCAFASPYLAALRKFLQADAVPPAVLAAVRRLLGFASGSEFADGPAHDHAIITALRASKSFLAVPAGTFTRTQRLRVQRCVAHGEAWLRACETKPAPLTFLASLADAPGDVVNVSAVAAAAAAAESAAVKATAAARLSVLRPLLRALTRERDLSRPLAAVTASAGKAATAAATPALDVTGDPVPSPLQVPAHIPVHTVPLLSLALPPPPLPPAPPLPPMPALALPRAPDASFDVDSVPAARVGKKRRWDDSVLAPPTDVGAAPMDIDGAEEVAEAFTTVV